MDISIGVKFLVCLFSGAVTGLLFTPQIPEQWLNYIQKNRIGILASLMLLLYLIFREENEWERMIYACALGVGIFFLECKEMRQGFEIRRYDEDDDK